MVYIRIEAEVRPTEDELKVVNALKNIVDSDNVRIEDLGNEYRLVLIEETKVASLIKLYIALRRQRVLDTARSIFLKNLRNNAIEFKLNKQALTQNVLSFVEDDRESPLGPVKVFISSPKIELLIDWLAPRTARGRPLWELELPKDV